MPISRIEVSCLISLASDMALCQYIESNLREKDGFPLLSEWFNNRQFEFGSMNGKMQIIGLILLIASSVISECLSSIPYLLGIPRSLGEVPFALFFTNFMVFFFIF